MRGTVRAFWLVFAGVIVLPVLGVGGALALETFDPFCAVCHSEPETTYYSRSIQSKQVDLASFHAPKGTRCIDCHSGAGMFGRVRGLQQGAHDLAAFFSGKYHRPAITTNPLGDDSCVKCHPQILERTTETRKSAGAGLTGHYHFYLLKWRHADPQAARCMDCHTAHTIGIERLLFMPQGKVGAICDECHTALSGKIE